MATSTDEMSTPVTRDEPQQVQVRLDQSLEQLEQKLARLATKDDLEPREAVLARLDLFEHRFMAALARHSQTIIESISAQISAINEKHPGKARTQVDSEP